MRVPAQLQGVCKLLRHVGRKIIDHFSVAVVPGKDNLELATQPNRQKWTPVIRVCVGMAKGIALPI